MTFSTGIFSTIAAVAAIMPTKPADGFRDDGRVFSTETRQALVRERAGLAQQTGIQLFIDTNTYLDGSQSAGERSRALLKAWADNQRGVIICVDRSSRGLPILHVSADLWQRYTEPELITVLRLAAEEMGRSKVTEESITSGVRLLMKELGELEILARQRGNAFQSSDLLFAGIFSGCLFLGGFVIMLVARRLGQGEDHRAVQYYLPDVEVGQRFGAPCGGGVVVEVQYRR
jgi:hypothetical protein